jgi:hypothetical protein
VAATIVSTGVLVTATTVVTVTGVAAYQVSRDGVVLATVTNPRFIDPYITFHPGTYTYQVAAVGPRGRVGQAGSVTVTMAGLGAPVVTVTSPSAGKVTFTPAAVPVPAGSRWVVWRNNLPIKELDAAGAPPAFSIANQSKGPYTYQLQLISADGASPLSTAQTVVVK